jgi:hypothetical protein
MPIRFQRKRYACAPDAIVQRAGQRGRIGSAGQAADQHRESGEIYLFPALVARSHDVGCRKKSILSFQSRCGLRWDLHVYLHPL